MVADDRIKREADYHDRRFESENEPRQKQTPFYRLMLPANMLYHEVVESYAHNGRVLEYGCGKGENTLTFARRGVTITGIDISQSGVAHARTMASEAGLDTVFEVMDAENLTFAPNTFSAVAGKGILHHLDLDRAFAEIARVLTIDGRAVFIEPLGHNPLINWYRRLTPDSRTQDEHPLLVRDLDKARSYFRSLEMTFFNLTTLCAVVFLSDRAFNRVFPVCRALDTWLFDVFPWIGRYSWMVFMDMRQPIKQDGP